MAAFENFEVSRADPVRLEIAHEKFRFVPLHLPILDRHAAEQVVEFDSFVRCDSVLIRSALGTNPKVNVEQQRVAVGFFVSVEQNVAVATEEFPVLIFRTRSIRKSGVSLSVRTFLTRQISNPGPAQLLSNNLLSSQR